MRLSHKINTDQRFPFLQQSTKDGTRATVANLLAFKCRGMDKPIGCRGTKNFIGLERFISA